MNKLIFIISFLFCFNASAERPGWVVNPFAKENPLFYGGPDLFASSRVGQVYMPGLGVSLGRPVYLMASNMLSSKGAMALSGVATDLMAHMSWRLGCDQGYLQAKELKFNDYPSLDSYLFGSSLRSGVSKIESITTGEKSAGHPLLAFQKNQNITPTALLFFGMGQVIGQRYVGPFITKRLSKFRILNKKMGVKMSKSTMDIYGWPVDGQFGRHEAIGKISGILVGTYLGWSMNDMGWQLANWNRFSLDTFSQYMPYFGVDGVGSIDKGWGTFGFTMGGLLGHNIGASAAVSGLRKVATPGGMFLDAGKNARGWGTFLKHGSAISGNLVMGLTLTTYFPHLFKKIFDLYPDSIAHNTAPKTIDQLSDEEIEGRIKELAKASTDSIVENLYSSILLSSNEVERELKMQLIKANVTAGDLKEVDLSDASEIAVEAVDRSQIESLLVAYSQKLAEDHVAFYKSVKGITLTSKNIKQEAIQIISGMIIPEMVLDYDRAVQSVKEVISGASDDSVRNMLIDFSVIVYPTWYKYQFAKSIEKYAETIKYENVPTLVPLLMKRDIVTSMILAKKDSMDEKEWNEIVKDYSKLHEALVHKNMDAYSNNPEILSDYNKHLDLIFDTLDKI